MNRGSENGLALEEETSIPSGYRRVAGIVLAIYWAALFIGTHLPPSEQVEPPLVSDKLMHFSGYCGLSVLLTLWQATKFRLNFRRLLMLFFVVSGYGITDELTQIPVGRDAELLDWFADLGGSICGVLACAGGLRWFRERSGSC